MVRGRTLNSGRAPAWLIPHARDYIRIPIHVFPHERQVVLAVGRWPTRGAGSSAPPSGPRYPIRNATTTIGAIKTASTASRSPIQRPFSFDPLALKKMKNKIITT